MRQPGQCFRRSSPLRGSPPFSGANADSSIDPAGFKYYLSSWLNANV